jgi:hypothetical protein|tara:strand:- start:65 stop:361 length:297 start_codon:yes stop_codon:yes gene_type:complete
MKLKDLLSENMLGALPSSKLMKMKWNPVTDKKSQVTEDKINEEYIESMDHKAIDKHLSAIEMQWLDWKRGPMTERSDIKPAADELTHYILLWMRKKFK